MERFVLYVVLICVILILIYIIARCYSSMRKLVKHIDILEKSIDQIKENAVEIIQQYQEKAKYAIKVAEQKALEKNTLSKIIAENSDLIDEGRKINKKRRYNQIYKMPYREYDLIIDHYEMFINEVKRSFEELNAIVDIEDFIKAYNAYAAKTLVLDCMNEMIIGNKLMKKHHTKLSKSKKQLIFDMLERYERSIYKNIQKYYNRSYNVIVYGEEKALNNTLKKYIEVIEEYEYLFTESEKHYKYTQLHDNLCELYKMSKFE